MTNILLDYVLKISAIVPTAQASTAFLKQVLVVVKPKSGATEDTITLCTTKAACAAFTDNVEHEQLFDAGMGRVYMLAVDALTGLDTILAGANGNNFFTILISSDFSDAEMDAADFGGFEGVVAMASTDDAKNETRAAIENRSAWHSTSGNKAKNMFFAFGKLLSNSLAWRNQQYISMPFADDVDTLGEAENLFDKKINFVMSDLQYSNRLGLFAAGGKAITAPYIIKNLMIDLQSTALSYISGNQPDYTLTEASLLEEDLQKVITKYISKKQIPAGTVEVKLEEDDFVASGYFNVARPRALWRMFAEMKQTLNVNA